MAFDISTYDAKQIHELDPLNKLSGKEEVLIDDGELTYRVTVDTLLGYIRDQINASVGGSSINGSEATTIHFIPAGEEIPVTAREDGHYYINVQSNMSTGYRGGLTTFKISPNMGLRMIVE